MQNRQLGSGFGVVDIKFLSSIPVELEFEKFGPNEYVLIKTEEKIKLVYIDDDKIPVLDYIQKYHLKIHGGNEFLLFKDEKYQGLINSFPKEKMPYVHEWINSDQENKQDIRSILDDHTLALIIPDILVDL